MKAVIYKEYGSPEVLQVAEVPTPTPNKDEVLIRVHAAEATKSDCEMRSFKFPVSWFWLPLRLALGITQPRRTVLGGYFAGEVVSVGSDVSLFNVGEKVFGSSQLRLGGYGEYLALPESYSIASIPNHLSFEQSAAVPLGGWNALHFMHKADIKPKEKILVNGAGGSIGLFAVQIAKHFGAIVTAVDAAHKKNMLKDIGADHFIDYRTDDFANTNERFDVVFDVVASSSLTKCLKVLNPAGRYLTANPSLYKMLASPLLEILTGKSISFAFAKETVDELLILKSLLEQNIIKPVIDKVFVMEEAQSAHHRVESEQRLGSVILKIKQQTDVN